MNKKNIIIKKSFPFIASFFALLGCSNDEKQTVTTMNQLVMQDEFDVDGAPNNALWGFDIGKGPNGDGWGNNELQYYSNRPENVKVLDGVLQITAQKELYLGSQYTSAKILSKGKFSKKHGRFEARIKMPWGQGLWPAFWLLGSNIDEVGWPKCGEIDIMEYRGQQPTVTNVALHGPGYSGGNAISKSYTLVNDRFDTDFHIFGVEWGENYINFYVDAVLFKQFTPKDVTGEWVFENPFYMILNLAVGGSYVGPPNNETSFPQTMYVDYVRVYQ